MAIMNETPKEAIVDQLRQKATAYRDIDGKENGRRVTRDERRLLIRDEVLRLLQLPDDKVQQLINTRQITAFRIAGKEPFDSRDLNQLIESYKSTAARRAQ
ncbi:MAG: hypothetical protein JWQ49_5275 [Edaphobacter sp.]|nr:hypothetical protein [Edaphobacter sp.]